MQRCIRETTVTLAVLLASIVTAADLPRKPGDSLIVIRSTEMKCAKDTMLLTVGTKLVVMPGDDPANGESVPVTLVAVGRIGHVDRGAVISQSDAITYFTNAIEKKPDDAVALSARGKVWFHMGDKDKAIADLDEGIRILPDSSALTIRAWARKQQGQADKAIADFDEAIRLNPRESLAWRVRGATWAGKNDYAKAQADFTEAIRVDPYNVDALNHRASFAAGSKDPDFRNGDQAIADATRACELTDWKETRYLQTLAAAYAEKGDWDQALKWVAKSIERTPEGARKSLNELQQQFEKKQPYRRSW